VGVCVGLSVGVCVGLSVGVWAGVTAAVGVFVTSTVVVLLELHPVMAAAVTAVPPMIAEIIFALLISYSPAVYEPWDLHLRSSIHSDLALAVDTSILHSVARPG
jgi:hypothetical protein